MARKMIAIKIRSKLLLEDMMELIHQKVNIKRHVQTTHLTVRKHKKNYHIGRERSLAHVILRNFIFDICFAKCVLFTLNFSVLEKKRTNLNYQNLIFSIKRVFSGI